METKYIIFDADDNYRDYSYSLDEVDFILTNNPGWYYEVDFVDSGWYYEVDFVDYFE